MVVMAQGDGDKASRSGATWGVSMSLYDYKDERVYYLFRRLFAIRKISIGYVNGAIFI